LFNVVTTFVIFLLTIPAILWGGDRGYELFQKSDYEKARSYYEEVLQKHRDNAEASYGLGTSAYKLADYQAAMEAFEKALATTDPDLKAKIYYNMGNALYQAQRLEESLAFYRKALELAPHDQDAKINYELLRYQMKPQQQQQSQNSSDKQKEKQEKKEEQQSSANQSQSAPKEQQSDSQENKDQGSQSQTAADSLPQEQQSPRDEQAQNQQQNLQQAKAILDALKENEKIHQKIKMARAKTRNLEKDW